MNLVVKILVIPIFGLGIPILCEVTSQPPLVAGFCGILAGVMIVITVLR